MLSHKPWSGYAAFRVFLGVFSTWCLGNLIVGVLFHFKIGTSEESRREIGMVVSLLFLQGAALLWIAFFLREQQLTWKTAFGFGRRGTGFAIGIGLAAGMLVLPIAQELIVLSESILLHFQVQPTAQVVVQELQKTQIGIVQRTFIGLLAIVGAPFVEESLFRGLLYPTIKQRGFPKLAFFGTSIVFALLHMNYETGHAFVSSLVTFVPLTFFAMVLILLYESTDNLLAPISAHAMFNFANFLLLLFQDVLNNAAAPTSVQ
jgi:membrane protease YdiL (CAAX protease family)